jgi:hypothetical protein
MTGESDMSFSIYDATIPNFLQGIGAVRALVARAQAHCAETGLDPQAVIGARLADDMLPFAYQVKSVAVHSLGAIEGVRKGQFSPDMSEPPATFDGLIERLDHAAATLAAVSREEMAQIVGRDMAFVVGERRIEFTADIFLMTFSLPNFYFHSSTAYAILRSAGLPIGKRDFLGQLRLKASA